MSRRSVLASTLALGCALLSLGCWHRHRRLDAPASELNARCYECHIDFRGEQLTEVHERVRRTPADATFRGKAMEVFCQSCHPPTRLGRVGAHVENKNVPAPRRKTCTGCHGYHVVVETSPAP